LKHKDWVIISLLALGWIIFLGQPTGVSARLRDWTGRLTTPLVKLGQWIPTVQSRRTLAQTNAVLQVEINFLRERDRAVRETVRENRRLQQLLDLKRRVAFPTVTARVIGRDASSWWQSIQIDQGSEAGLAINMPVLNADGLIGKTVAVSKGQSRVLLLLDPACQVSAILEESREPGVVRGVAAVFTTKPQCRMLYVNRSTQVSPGQTVLTSGLGGIFPKGIRIGTVLSAELDAQSGMYQNLDIDPAVDFRRLEEVIVILSQP